MNRLLELLQALTLVVSFIVTVVEAVYEGVEKAGEQKKKDALAQWNTVKPVFVSVVKDVLGDRWSSLVDKWVTDKVVGILIDLIVWWFNLRGFFKKS